MRIRKIGKRALKKTLILTLIIATKFAFIWRFFLLTHGAENALKNHQNKHFFCAETSTFFGAFSVPKENAKKAQIRQKSSFSYFLCQKKIIAGFKRKHNMLFISFEKNGICED